MNKLNILWYYTRTRRRTNTIRVPISVLLLVITPYCLLLRTVLSQRICSGDAMRTYKSCVLDNNPCPCSECDADPTDGTPVNFVDAPTSCKDIYDIFCPFVRCCSKCENVAYEWYQCAADNIAERWLQVTCDLQSHCDNYPSKDISVCTTDENSITTTTEEVTTPVSAPTTKAPTTISKPKSTTSPVTTYTNSTTTEKSNLASLENEASSASWTMTIPTASYVLPIILFIAVSVFVR